MDDQQTLNHASLADAVLPQKSLAELMAAAGRLRVDNLAAELQRRRVILLREQEMQRLAESWGAVQDDELSAAGQALRDHRAAMDKIVRELTEREQQLADAMTSLQTRRSTAQATQKRLNELRRTNWEILGGPAPDAECETISLIGPTQPIYPSQPENPALAAQRRVVPVLSGICTLGPGVK